MELPAENDQTYYPGYEQASLLTYCDKWFLANIKAQKNSRLRVFGENVKGQSVLLCRYLTPIKPPVEIVDLENGKEDNFAIERVARFVSMIPFQDDISMFQNLPDTYTTCQEFLDLGAGDYEEHAILLANYFQYIDDIQNKDMYESFLVFGEAMPEGMTTYVMRKKKAKTINNNTTSTSVELWQPLTGESYFFQEKNKN